MLLEPLESSIIISLIEVQKGMEFFFFFKIACILQKLVFQKLETRHKNICYEVQNIYVTHTDCCHCPYQNKDFSSYCTKSTYLHMLHISQSFACK